MNRSLLPYLVLPLVVVLVACSSGSSDPDYEALMERARIPGLAVAVIEDGKVASIGLHGVASAETGAPVSSVTLFEAASLSKPVFATAVLRLAERLEFDLDHPLYTLLADERISHDARSEALTARIVLSHRTGLPNWGGGRLEFGHDPGSRFGYSGEGYVYLQKVISYLTGLTLDEFVRQEVFEPFGMTHSRFSWPEGQELDLAVPHDESGRALEKRPVHEGNAAASLHTTAADYARFVVAWLGGEALGSGAAAEALTPVAFPQGDESDPPHLEEAREGIAWALGWGVQLDTDQAADRLYWHWGDNGGFKAFVAFRPATGDGIVYFANSQNGLAIGPMMVAEVVGDMSATFEWCGYERVDSPGFAERLEGSVAEAEGRLADALKAYRAAIEIAGEDETMQRRVEWVADLLEVETHPVLVPEEILASFVGRYGPRVLTLEEGVLRYQREGGNRYTLIPLAENLFAFEGMTFFRIELARDESGRVSAIIGHYVNGTIDESPRERTTAGLSLAG